MSAFWPSDITLEDTRSPMDILNEAKTDWMNATGGIMDLMFQESIKSYSDNPMIVVYAKHVPSNRTAVLLSVVHRPNFPYPASIEPASLPDSLKKSYLVRTPRSRMDEAEGKLIFYDVTNEWIADTPIEFQDKLRRVFDLGSVKGVILSLAANKPISIPNGKEQPAENVTATES